MNEINELETLKAHTLPDRIKLAESWIIRLKDSDLEDPDDYDLYHNALSIIIEAIESGRYHIKEKNTMTRSEQKKNAQDLIMNQLAKIGYGQEYDDFVRECFGDLSEHSLEEANALLTIQMDRIAKMFGYEKSWFY